MKRYTLSGGHTLPALGVGTWKSSPGVVGDAVLAAIRAGYRHIDCAPIYGNEAEIGEALDTAFAAGDVTRDELWITSKLWNTEHGRDQVLPALRRTLGDLGLDYVDLFLVHWPVPLRSAGLPEKREDFYTLDERPIADTWTGMEDAVEAGLTREIGVSNFSVSKLKALSSAARIRPAVCQVEMHPYLQQRDLCAYAKGSGLVLTAYSPLGSPDRPPGLRHDNEPALLEDPVIAEVAARHSATPGQVLIAWALNRGTSVIPKSAREARLVENFAAADLTLTPEDMAAIGKLEKGYRYVDGSFWCIEGSPHTLTSLWDEAA